MGPLEHLATAPARSGQAGIDCRWSERRQAVLQGIGVALFLQNSSLIKDDLCEIDIEEMPEARNTSLIAMKDRTRLKLVSEFINAAIE
jgi:hypothetical protein